MYALGETIPCHMYAAIHYIPCNDISAMNLYTTSYPLIKVSRDHIPSQYDLAMALTRVISSLPNMSLITLALRNEEEPKAKRVASRVKVLL